MDHGASFGEEFTYDYLILGAGPAGLQMGHHLFRAGHSYLILEAGDSPGQFFQHYPRHRTLLSNNKVFTGFKDPEISLRFDGNSLLDEDGDGGLRFKDFSRRYFPPADELVRYLRHYADAHALNVRCNTRILRVEKTDDGGFRLTGVEGNVFACRRLIVATGASKPYVPAIPGIERAETYAEVSIDPADFEDQRVLILGKGNSAFETADNLIPTAALIHVASPHPLQLAWQTHSLGDLRAVNNSFLDTFHLQAQNAVLDCDVQRIERRDNQFVVSVCFSHAQGETADLLYDRVIVCTGFRFDASIFARGCRPELVIDGCFPAQTYGWEAVNVPGLYFAGTLMQANDFQRGTSASIQGFRYNVRSLFRMLEERHHQRGWPSREIEPTPEGLLEATLARLNRSSALWQQFGFLHDVIVVDEDWDRAVYYEEMPLAYVHASEIGARGHYYTIALEPGQAERSAFLQPVIRRWRGRELTAEILLPEDLFGEWKMEEAHVAPLRCFYMGQLLASVDMAGGPSPLPLSRPLPAHLTGRGEEETVTAKEYAETPRWGVSAQGTIFAEETPHRGVSTDLSVSLLSR